MFLFALALACDPGPNPVVYDVELDDGTRGELILPSELEVVGRDPHARGEAMWVTARPLPDVIVVESDRRTFSWGSSLALAPDATIAIDGAVFVESSGPVFASSLDLCPSVAAMARQRATIARPASHRAPSRKVTAVELEQRFPSDERTSDFREDWAAIWFAYERCPPEAGTINGKIRYAHAGALIIGLPTDFRGRTTTTMYEVPGAHLSDCLAFNLVGDCRQLAIDADEVCVVTPRDTSVSHRKSFSFTGSRDECIAFAAEQLVCLVAGGCDVHHHGELTKCRVDHEFDDAPDAVGLLRCTP